MGIRIGSNVLGLSMARRLGETDRLLGRSYARLASGLRIATAADDPAGVGIAARMRSEVRSLVVARRNTEDGVSLLKVADGTLSELSEIIERTRELGVKAASETLSQRDRQVIDSERASLAEDAARLVDSARFNGIDLFAEGGDFFNNGIAIQVGTERGETVDLKVSDISRVLEVLQSIRFSSSNQASRSLDSLDVGLDMVSSTRGEVGALQNRLESAGRVISSRREAMAEALSRVQDVDIAAETAELTRLQILQESGTLLLAQANFTPTVALDLIRGALFRP
ncbi:Flagellin [Planctomycetes bacterium Poly30]|uniref:Flagellin n=1 Tax=Saltatorellus ferox TaxID=2528018 RepID=A0A518ER66_9BACT|nr:Flagellin [Planctomycetes bacterium Poly30]